MIAALAFVAGVIFAIGLAIADMTSPARIRGFLDIGGAWDPTLAFVMAGAIAVFAPVARLVRGRSSPLLGGVFDWPERKAIDRRLVFGSIVFGIGWGLAGLCPGPALVSVGGAIDTGVFVAAMLGGIALARRIR